jgi:hypothetical protein
MHLGSKHLNHKYIETCNHEFIIFGYFWCFQTYFQSFQSRLSTDVLLTSIFHIASHSQRAMMANMRTKDKDWGKLWDGLNMSGWNLGRDPQKMIHCFG